MYTIEQAQKLIDENNNKMREIELQANQSIAFLNGQNEVYGRMIEKIINKDNSEEDEPMEL